MEKRLILAIALSALIMFLWSLIAPKPAQIHPISSVESKIETLSNLPAVEEDPSLTASLVTFSTDKFDVIFDEKKAAIKEIIFKDYQSYNFKLDNALFMPGEQNFQRQSLTNNSITFVENVQNNVQKRIVKQFIFSNPNYFIELEINVQNLSKTAPLIFKCPILLGSLDLASNPGQAHFTDIIVAKDDKITHLNPQKEQQFAFVKFVGLRDRYFCAIIESDSGNYSAAIRKSNKKSELMLQSGEISMQPEQSIIQKFSLYIGPQQVKLINVIKPNWAGIVHYGGFDFISQILLQLLDIFYRLVHNWGWAIIILSIVIYFVLFPLSVKQMRSMKEMQVLQPRVEELRNTYKDNPQRLNREILDLYKEHKVNPLGGCLPLLLQMPIFFGLYQALMRSVELKGAQFLWIKDLSEPDRLITLSFNLPVISNEINILPLMMIIGMFIQQKLSTTVSTAVSAGQQKLMLILMPLMFGFIFYHMPAGLVLYWLVNSILMLAQQVKTLKNK